MASIVTGAMLFAPLIFSFLAGFVTERRNPTAFPAWINYVRVLPVGLAMVAPALASFIERHISSLPAQELSQRTENLELIAFVTCSSSFLSPATVSVISFLAGAPAMDVYLSSAYSFLGVSFWSWRKHALFRAPAEDPKDIGQRHHASPKTVLFSRGYTILLRLLGAAALSFLIPKLILITYGLRPSTGSVSLEIFVSAIYLILAVVCWITARLRTRSSSYAIAATGAISFMLLCWFPLGTAAFIYWIGWVRKTEING